MKTKFIGTAAIALAAAFCWLFWGGDGQTSSSSVPVQSQSADQPQERSYSGIGK